MSLYQAFRAGFVRRWHANPDLAHTNDRIDAHSGRVARIILMWHPAPSIDLLSAALRHDDGEMAVGDMKAPLKVAHPNIAKHLDLIEARERRDIWGYDDSELTMEDQQWLSFADRLDALMWAAHHGANLLRDGWPEAKGRLFVAAEGLGCEPALRQLYQEVTA